ncbi:MAG: hypothetical protein IJ955_10310 [Oscillospiraceae bacterium]|nr:hypothetical protein [Oscillospiraceae bacterium]
MSIDKLSDLGDRLLTVLPYVYHFEADHAATAPYIVWSEDGGGTPVFANNQMQVQPITGTVDLFTADAEERSLFYAVQQVLNNFPCCWYLNSIQREEDSGLMHYEWVWEVC